MKYNKYNKKEEEYNRQYLYKELYEIMKNEYNRFTKKDVNTEKICYDDLQFFCKNLRRELKRYDISNKAKHYKLINMLESNSKGKYGIKHSLFLFNCAL